MNPFATLPYRRVQANDVDVVPYRSRLSLSGGRVAVSDDRATGTILVDGSVNAPLIRLHEREDDTVALYQLNGTLVDSGLDGFDLALSAGNERYSEIAPGLIGVVLTSTTKYNHAATGTALLIPGDVSLEFICSMQGFVAGGAFVSYDNVGETEADNVQYAIALDGADGDTLEWFSEHGAGVNDTYRPNRSPALYAPCLVAASRIANVIRFYMNGKPFGAASSALPTPTGGTAASLWLGYEGNPTAACILASLRITARGKSAAEFLASYNYCFGQFYGEVS